MIPIFASIIAKLKKKEKADSNGNYSSKETVIEAETIAFVRKPMQNSERNSIHEFLKECSRDDIVDSIRRGSFSVTKNSIFAVSLQIRRCAGEM